METKILDINEWNTFIHKKKKEIINDIEKNNTFDKSKESLIFNSILKEVSTINIFNLSYIRKWYDESIITCWSAYEHNCELYYKRLLQNTW